MTDQKELERIKRIRDQQIKVRYDPDEKRARYDKISIQRRQAPKVTVGSVLKDVPHKVWWSLIGGSIGLAFLIIILNLPGASEYAQYTPYLGLAGIVFGLVVGFILGKARDSGKEDWGPKGRQVMTFDIEITHSAEKDLNRLRAFHRSKILGALEQYLGRAPTQVSHSRIKRLRLMDSPAYRLRIGDYRVYYDIDEVEQTVTVLRVLHKQDSFDYLHAAGGDA